MIKGPNPVLVQNQKTLLGKKNGLGNAFFVSKLKNNVPSMNSIKVSSKFVEEEFIKRPYDQENEKYTETDSSHLLPSSKKIQKSSINVQLSRSALENLTNFYKTKTITTTSQPTQKVLKIQTTLPFKKNFVEDPIKKTSNYVPLVYLNTRTRKTQQFYCFHDRDLGIEISHSTQTIEHTCDNDCTTDEEQIKGAVKNLYKTLENYVKEQK